MSNTVNLGSPNSSREEEEFMEGRALQSMDRVLVQSSSGAAPDSTLRSVFEERIKQKEDAPLQELESTMDFLTAQSQSGYVRLSNEEKKWFRKYKSEGYSNHEARFMILKKRISKDLKRKPSDELTPENQSKRKKDDVQMLQGTVQAREGSIFSEYSQAVTGVRVGVLAADYPVTLLSKNQMRSIEGELLQRVLLQVASSVKLKFSGFYLKQGFCIVNCANEETAEWVVSLASNLSPWEGANLKIIREDDIPKAQVVIAYFPNSRGDSNEKILQFVTAQNKKLSVEDWKILIRNQIEDAVELTILVDAVSKEKLLELGLRVYFKFGSAHFRLKRVKRTERAE